MPLLANNREPEIDFVLPPLFSILHGDTYLSWSYVSMINRLAYFIASCGYAGYFPIAPGTVGSAVGVVFYLLLQASGFPWAMAVALAVAIIAGIWAGDVVERTLDREDPSLVVVDELAGMLLSLWLIPLSWRGIVVGFLVFRLLDIVKPFPCRQAERLNGGLGIMTDDLIAGLYTNGILRLASLFLPSLLK